MTDEEKERDRALDELIKDPLRMVVAVSQHAASIVGDMTSSYWSLVEGKPGPGVFMSQTRERIKSINNLLVLLEAENRKRAKKGSR